MIRAIANRKSQVANPSLQPELALFTPTTVLPGARPGEWIIRQGKPVVQSPRVTVAQAAQILSLSARRIRSMCDEGIFIEGTDWFRPGSDTGKIFLLRDSVMERLKGSEDRAVEDR